MQRRHLLTAGIALAMSAWIPMTGCDVRKPKFNSVDITGSHWGGDFRLTDHNGVKRSMADFHGKVVLLFFGFTQCPDVCPTTLSKMAEVMKLMGKDSDRVQVLFVTIDPERDTQDILKAYVPQFDPRFLGLRASAGETLDIAKHFNAFYRKVDGQTPTSYTMDHATFTYGFDVRGQSRLLVPHNLEAPQIAGDVRLLLSMS